jgi:hypothetical protein
MSKDEVRHPGAGIGIRIGLALDLSCGRDECAREVGYRQRHILEHAESGMLMTVEVAP